MIKNTVKVNPAKMNQTATSAFSPPAEQMRLELMHAGNVYDLIATTNSD